MFDQLPAYLVAVALITVSPGPDTVLVLNRALLHGRRAAVLTACGSASGLLVWGAASAIGIATLLASSTTAFTVLKLAGALYLGYLGLRLIWHSRHRADAPASTSPAQVQEEAPRSFRQGLLTNLLNPKAGAFFTALLPQFVDPGSSAVITSLVYAGIAAAASLIGLTVYAQLAHRARRLLLHARARQLLDRVTGSVLIALGFRLALERR